MRHLLIAASLGLTLSSVATAQEPVNVVTETVKNVVLDPTTYIPAALSYDGRMRDWTTSQAFFEHGYLERNPRFTVSGVPNSAPMSFEDGKRVIVKDILVHVGTSALHNAASRTVERLLIEKHPEKRKLIRVLGWVERAAMASFLSYQWSGAHYRQWRANERMIQQNGW